MNIQIVTIEHRHQRYNTCGDWQFIKSGDDPHDHKRLEIKVSHLGDWRMEALVAIHELVEALLCKDRGISEEAVTAFDVEYEKYRERNIREAESVGDGAAVRVIETQEPGDHPAAPYHSEHIFANAIERRVAEELGVNLGEYERAIAEAGK